jgi:hypothetical protein
MGRSACVLPGALPSNIHGKDTEQDRDLSRDLISDGNQASYLSTRLDGVYLSGLSRYAAAAAYVYADGDSYGGYLCLRQHDQ